MSRCLRAASGAASAALAAALATAALACGEEPHAHPSPHAVDVVDFTPGEGAGFGQDALPDVVLGPPDGGYTAQGSTDVVSLGRGGVITLALGLEAVDGDGPDLLVFENPFAVGNTGAVFSEPGEVQVSEDGESFVAFPCAPADPAPNGCAGFALVHAGSTNDLDPTDPAAAGGDAFDLASVGVARARFVRIVDRMADEGSAVAPTAGFDLDAVAVVGGAAP